MTEHILNPRIIENKDWATLLFVLSFVLITITKASNEGRFGDFINLIYSDKYMKVYRDPSYQNSRFSFAFFWVQCISFAFFIHLSISILNNTPKTDYLRYIQVITFFIFFILTKQLISKIIGTAFDIEENIEQFNIQKATYRTYIGLIILPFNVILFYNENISVLFPQVLLAIILIMNTLGYILAIKNYQNLIISKLFYFILYLCTLEIAPYFFMYYWYTKVSA